MATVRIKRTSVYVNRMHGYVIYIDGTKVGSIANGDTIELSVSAGQHRIHAKIDWCLSPALFFDIAENEVKTFSTGGFTGAKWLMPVGLFFIALYFLLQFFFEVNSFFF